MSVLSSLRRLPAHRALAAALAGFAFWAVLFPLTNTDIWWHLSAGREMVERKWFLYRDPFSYAPEGARWIDLHWLFQLLAYAVHSAAGVPGLILAKASVFAAAAAVLLKVSWRRETAPAAVALLAGIVYFTRFQVLVRPGVLSLLYLASFILVIETYRRGKHSKVLWLLPAIQVLWTNTQGIFILGPVTLLCYVLGDAASLRLARSRSKVVAFEAALDRRQVRTVGKFLLITCAACLVSPYGPWGLALPFTLYSRIDPQLAGIYARNVAENAPSWVALEAAPEKLPFLVCFTVIGLASFVLARRRTSVPRLMLFAAYFYLGMIAERNVSLYMFVLAPVTVLNLNAALEEGKERHNSLARWLPPWSSGAAAAAALAVMLLAAVGVARSHRRDPSRLGLAPFRYPVEAAEILEREDFEGNVFNSVRYGGYLIWRLYPHKQVFIDGRLVIRSREQFRDFLNLLDNPLRFGDFRERHGITRAVLPTAAVGRSPGRGRYSGVARHLYRDPDWRLDYADGSCALFVYDPERERPGLDLDSPGNMEGIATRLDKRWRANRYVRKQAQLNLCGLLMYLGHYDRAAEILAGLSSADSFRHLARCRYFQGRLDEAHDLSEKLLRDDPRDTDSLNLLGQIRLEGGDVKGALEYFGRTIGIDPYDRYAGEAIDRIEAALKLRVGP